MTQMLLFDSPSSTASFGGSCVAAPVGQDSVGQDSVAHKAVAESCQSRGAEAACRSPRADRREQDSGLHHMGDLARLVLLRYELVAKRRAVLAARKAK